MIGKGFGVLIDDRDTRGAPPVSYGTLRTDDLHTIGHLILASPELNGYLAPVPAAGAAARRWRPRPAACWRAPTPWHSRPGSARSAPILARLYRRFVDRPGRAAAARIARARSTTATTPWSSAGSRSRRRADRWIRLRDRALTHMLNFTLATSAIVVAAILAFAAWLALRLSRLRRASESALTRSGLVTTFPETSAPR